MLKNYCLNWINNELMKWVSHCYYFKDLALLTFSHYIFFYTLNISFYFFHLSLKLSAVPIIFTRQPSFLSYIHFSCLLYTLAKTMLREFKGFSAKSFGGSGKNAYSSSSIKKCEKTSEELLFFPNNASKLFSYGLSASNKWSVFFVFKFIFIPFYTLATSCLSAFNIFINLIYRA